MLTVHSGINYSSWTIVNLIFNYWIKGRFFAWWTKYNYVMGTSPAGMPRTLDTDIVTAAALDTGTALAGIIIFFAVSYPGYSFPDWWGNTVPFNTADGNGTAWYAMPDSGYFGPPPGSWS